MKAARPGGSSAATSPSSTGLSRRWSRIRPRTLEAGDLIATGTVSGADEEARACLAEIVFRGGEVIELPDGSTRKQLEDGDTLTIRGRAIAEGYVSIGFGECSGTIHPALELA